MSGRMGILAGVLCLLVGGCFVSWFLSTEVVPVTVTIPPSGPARSNPYHAAECYLEQLGLEVETTWSPPKEPRGEDLQLIMFFAPERHALPRRDQAILRWVEQGGHLVVVARRPEEGKHYVQDPLTEPFGVQARSLSGGGGSTFQAEGEQLQLNFAEPFYLTYSRGHEEERKWQYSQSGSLHAIGFARGKGLVTILSSAELWSTQNLRGSEHARFLQQVARLRADPGGPLPKQGLIVRGDSPPSLLGLLWFLAWPLITTLLIWLVVWLYGRTRRFGPVLPAPSTDRRRLGEHLEAAARFLWRHRGQNNLIEPVREAVLDRVRRRRPDWAHLRRDAQVEKLADLIEVHPGDVEEALHGPPPRSPERFTRTVTLLERLRRSL